MGLSSFLSTAIGSKVPAKTMKEPTLDQTLACIDPMTVDNYDDLTLHLTNILEEARNARDHREISKHRLRFENFVPDAQKALNQIEHECIQDATKCEFWVGRLWVLIWTILRHPRDTVESSESEPHTGERTYRYVRNNTLNHLERIIHLRREMRDTSVSVAVPELINKWRDLFNDIAFGIEDSLNPYIRHYLGMSLPDEWTERVRFPHKWSSTKHYRSQGNLEDPLDERILVSLPETLEIHASAKADTRDDA